MSGSTKIKTTFARELKALERAGLLVRRRGAIVLTDTAQLRRLIEERRKSIRTPTRQSDRPRAGRFLITEA